MQNLRDLERVVRPLLVIVCFGLISSAALAADVKFPGVEVTFGGAGDAKSMSSALQIVLALTAISLAPAILISVTAFTRIIIVLSMLRHALGMPETPPNSVLISLALFLTLFTMMPVLQEVHTRAAEPVMAGKLQAAEALEAAKLPVRDFMLRQTREQDLAVMVEVAKAPMPKTVEEVQMAHLVPAFMLSELKTAFQIGFVVFLPFLLIDLIVSSVLMSMGMMMVPPVTISLPIKVLTFVLIDGWNILAKALVGSFH